MARKNKNLSLTKDPTPQEQWWIAQDGNRGTFTALDGTVTELPDDNLVLMFYRAGRSTAFAEAQQHLQAMFNALEQAKTPEV